ncbi:DUF4058 family protein [Anaerolineales bacterium HSG6]|nr:DUF4058 family protein [Anaerolineales bacterium HSG6]
MKPTPRLTKYRQKRERIKTAGVHLLEIDLLRRGTRVWQYERIPKTDYLMALTRATADRMEVWPIKLTELLPIFPVPLRYPDKDALLDLPAALNAIYDEAYYHLSIDYQADPPPPATSTETLAWIRERVDK